MPRRCCIARLWGETYKVCHKETGSVTWSRGWAVWRGEPGKDSEWTLPSSLFELPDPSFLSFWLRRWFNTWLTAASFRNFRKCWEDGEHLGTFTPFCVEWGGGPDGHSPPPLSLMEGFPRFVTGREREEGDWGDVFRDRMQCVWVSGLWLATEDGRGYRSTAFSSKSPWLVVQSRAPAGHSDRRHSCSICTEPGTLPSAVCCSPLRQVHYCPHYADKESGAQRDWVSCPRTSKCNEQSQECRPDSLAPEPTFMAPRRVLEAIWPSPSEMSPTLKPPS